MTHIALLRGINVGGKNKLPMKDLAAIFSDAGGSRIRTYIQSGNVVFDATSEVAAAIPGAVEAEIRRRFGYEVPIVMRTAEELSEVVRRNPFQDEAAEPKTLQVGFLSETPEPGAVAALDPDRSPPDRFAVLGREVYLHCPNGIARSKLTNAWFDSKLRVISTMRNWTTVQKLLSMAG